MTAMPDALTGRAAEFTARREPFVRATVVRAQRPTSAHAGDTALVDAQGVIDGFVGGNCVEASVRQYSLMTLSTREPLLLRVVPGEPSRIPEPGAVEVTNPCLSGGAVEIFLEPQLPPPRVVVIGTTPVAHALVTLGADMGLDMVQTEGLSAEPHPDDTALIVASHGRDEEPALEAGLRAGVPYVALVASPTRGAAVVASLSVDDAERERIHSPAGLDLGAHTPGEIAVSILAEFIQERSKDGHPPVPATAAPAVAVDPVCGMTVAAVPASLHAEVDGTTYYFCSTGCRTAFLANPAQYSGVR